MKRGLWLIAIIVILVFGLIVMVGLVTRKSAKPTGQVANTDANETLYGISWSPKSSNVTDLTDFFREVGQVGKSLSWAGPYADLTKKAGNPAKTVLEQSAKYSYTPVIITGPAEGEVFDSTFRQDFRAAILDFVEQNEVPYLGIGNEIDKIYLESPQRFATFLELAESLASEVRTISPETKVFTIFQLERVKGLQGGLFGSKNDPKNNLWGIVNAADGFDLIAFTTYPCLIYQTPTDLPEEYYSEIVLHTTRPVIFSEIGWFREGPVKGWESDEAEQAEFITRFNTLTTSLAPKIVLWPFLYDQQIPAPFERMGLLGTDQSTSAGFEAWKAIANDTQP